MTPPPRRLFTDSYNLTAEARVFAVEISNGLRPIIDEAVSKNVDLRDLHWLLAHEVDGMTSEAVLRTQVKAAAAIRRMKKP